MYLLSPRHAVDIHPQPLQKCIEMKTVSPQSVHFIHERITLIGGHSKQVFLSLESSSRYKRILSIAKYCPKKITDFGIGIFVDF